MEAIDQESIVRQVISRATFEPDWFCSELLQMPNDPWQSEVFNAIADLDRIKAGIKTLFNDEGKRRFTIKAFHGPGKTHFIAKLMHWYNFTRKGRIVATAPKEKQLTTRLWPEFRKIKSHAKPEYQQFTKVDRTAITWLGDVDWCAIAETAANPENLAGYHDENLCFLVEEASGVNEELFPAIEGALTTEEAILVLIGNPTRTQGEFYNSHMKKGTKELYYQKSIQHHETPRISQAWVNGMVAKYGKESPVVQVRVFGNFVDTEENQLLPLQWVVDAFNREHVPDGSIPRVRVSVDVADGGEDSSVVSSALHYETFSFFIKQQVFNFAPAIAPIETAKAAARIFDALSAQYPHCDGDIVVDSVGVGAGTAGWLIDKHYPVVRYMGGAGSDNPKLYRNRRTQSYISYRDALRDGRVVYADDYFDRDDEDDFLAQHTSIKTKPGSERIEDLMTKQEMKAKGIKSPDMVDPCAMHYATQTPTIGHSSIELTAIPSMVQQEW